MPVRGYRRVLHFGVFDGHGGAELSHKCSELLPAKLHDAASDRAIEDAFWEVDAELGRQALTQGTTASCLCIRPTEAGHDIMLAWVGDSRVIEVDMMAGSSNLVYRTSMHQPDNDQERRRIEMQWKARQAMRDREADEATTPVENISAEFDGTPLVVKGRLVGGTPVVTKDDLLDAGLMDDGVVDLALTARGLEYEARLNSTPIDLGGRSLKRVDSMIARRLDPYGRGRIGPRVVETVYVDLQTSKLLPGPSTCMTRSIGDWDSARVCLRTGGPPLSRAQVGRLLPLRHRVGRAVGHVQHSARGGDRLGRRRAAESERRFDGVLQARVPEAERARQRGSVRR